MKKILISGKTFSIEPGLVKGSDIYRLGSLEEGEFLYLEQNQEIDIPVELDDFLVIKGNEEFSTAKGSPKIEINPCLRVPIELTINGIDIKGDQALKRPKVKGIDLKNLDREANHSQTLFIDIPGLPDEKLGDHQVLILQQGQQFITTPCGNVGNFNPILERQLAEVRLSFPTAELIPENQNQFNLIIKDFPLPPFWSQSKVDLLIAVNKGFPVVPLDMFYVSPDLKLQNGQVPRCADVKSTFLREVWQRFSWHYQSRSWNPSLDSLLSHIRFCQSRLSMAM